MKKEIVIPYNNNFTFNGGTLVQGDIAAYYLTITLPHLIPLTYTATAINQENGNYSDESIGGADGRTISVKLVNSMYNTVGYATIRLVISDGGSVLTAKEIKFNVVAANNQGTMAEDEPNILSALATAVADSVEAKADAAEAKTMVQLATDTTDENAADIVDLKEQVYQSATVGTLANNVLGLQNGLGELAGNTYTKTEIDSKITGVYKLKGTVSTYGGLPSSNQQIGDVYNVAEAYSKTFYGYNVVAIALYGQGFEGEEAYITLDSVDGFSSGDVITVRDSGKTIIGSFTVQGVNTTAKQLYFSYAVNDDYTTITSRITGTYGADGEFPINTVFYFLGNHITSSTATQESIVKILYSAGGNVVWDGLTWDSLPGIVDFSDYYNKSQIDDIIENAIGTVLGGAY